MSDTNKSHRIYTCGTRAVVDAGGSYVIVCATCGKEKRRFSHTLIGKSEAMRVCTDTSSKPCGARGCDAR